MNSVPWFLIFSQVVNLGLIFCLYFFFLRKKVFSFFHEREKNFLQRQEASKALTLKAKEENKKIKDLLQLVENTYTREIEKAKRNAQNKKKNLLLEAKKEAQKILEKGEAKIKQEERRLLKTLRKKLLDQAFKQTKDHLTNLVSSEKKKALEKRLLNYFQN